MIWWYCCCTHKDFVMVSLWCPLTYLPFLFSVFASLQHTLSLIYTHPSLALSLSSCPHWPPSWLDRASPLVSWLPCLSGQPWTRPTGPLPCLTLACSSTNKLWPACSFSSRLLSFHQVWLQKQAHLVLWPPSGGLEPFTLAPACLGLGRL